jgi:hypothetical protein
MFPGLGKESGGCWRGEGGNISSLDKNSLIL